MIEALGKLWLLFTPSEQRKGLGVLALVVVMAGLETVGVVSIMPFLSVLGRPEVIHENAWLNTLYRSLDFDGERDFIIGLGLASILLVVGSSLFKALTLHALNRFVHLQRHSISVRLLARYLHQPYEFFVMRNTAELGKNILSEVDLLVANMVLPVAQMIAQGTIVLAMALLVFIYDPLMAISILLVVGAIYGLIYSLARRRLKHIGAESQQANKERYQACNEALAGIKDVKITHSVAAYLARFNRSARLFARHQASSDTISQTPLYMVEAIGYTGLIVIAILLMMQTDDIGHVLPALGLYGFAAYRLLPAVQVIYRGLARLRFASASLERISGDFALPAEERAGSAAPLRPQREIRLEDIRFAYPSTPDKPVIDDFSLSIPVNGSLAIIGKSGAGKSTLMDILLGLLQPQRGRLLVDGVEIGTENVQAWQAAIGYVPQHIYLMDASVAENIALGITREKIDMQALERAAKVAQIHYFVMNELAQGYDTFIGERGIRLSGGQRQRIGIARALYRDPPVLLFDEATSALDIETEIAFGESLRRLAGSRTVVLISHREESVSGCQGVFHLSSCEDYVSE